MPQIKDFSYKLIAKNTDLLLMQDADTNETYKIKKQDLFSNIALEKKTLNIPLSLLASEAKQISVTLGNAYILSKVSCSVSNLRVRLHLSKLFSDVDLNRSIGVILPASHGLIYEAVFENNIVSLDVLPSAIGVAIDDTTLTVNNLSNVNITSQSITFEYINF